MKSTDIECTLERREWTPAHRDAAAGCMHRSPFSIIALTPPQNDDECDDFTDIDARGPDGQTPLHTAAMSCHNEDTLACLIDEGASISAVTDQYGT